MYCQPDTMFPELIISNEKFVSCPVICTDRKRNRPRMIVRNDLKGAGPFSPILMNCRYHCQSLMIGLTFQIPTAKKASHSFSPTQMLGFIFPRLGIIYAFVSISHIGKPVSTLCERPYWIKKCRKQAFTPVRGIPISYYYFFYNTLSGHSINTNTQHLSSSFTHLKTDYLLPIRQQFQLPQRF